MKAFSSTTLLTILILWLLLLEAVWTNTETIRIAEGVPAGQLIHDISQCSQYISSGAYYVRTAVEHRFRPVFEDYFTLHNAVITARVEVDRDAIAAALFQTHLPVSFEITCFVIVVEDGSAVVSHTVILEILDRNDNRPRFRTTGVDHISIGETSGGVHLLELAVDPDQGENSTQIYYLEPPQTW